MFVVRGPIYKGILSMTNIKGNSKFSKALLPKKYLKELNDNPKFLKNYRSALAMAIALLAMCVTNFVLDAPLTAMLTNYLNEKRRKRNMNNGILQKGLEWVYQNFKKILRLCLLLQELLAGGCLLSPRLVLYYLTRKYHLSKKFPCSTGIC